MRIVQYRAADLEGYMSVSIAFWVRERYEIENDALGQRVPVDPAWMKDYDACEEDRPDHKPLQFDTTPWVFLGVEEGGEQLAAATLARSTPEFDLLQNRDDLVHVIDFRVRPEVRGKGIGRTLWQACENWSKERGAIDIRVETQDVNVPACRFYQSMGCRLQSVNREAYGPRFPEVQLIWSKLLSA